MRATEALIAAHGVDALRVADILRESQMANGTFYARFGSRDGLIREVQDRLLSHLEARIAADCSGLTDPDIKLDQALATVVGSMVTLFRDNAGVLRGFMQRGAADTALRERAGLTRGRVQAQFEHVLRPRLPPTHAAPDRVLAMAYGVLSSVLIERVSADESVPVEQRLPWEVVGPELTRLLLAYLTGDAQSNN